MSKLANKIIAVLAALVLAVSFVFATSYFASLGTVSAENVASPLFGGNATITENVKYGESFSVAAPTRANTKCVVIAPDGKVTSVDTDKNVIASQLGAYEVRYYEDGTNNPDKSSIYSYFVKVTVDKSYKLVVEGGAKIPTYAKLNDSINTKDGDKTTIQAVLYSKAEDENEWFPEYDADITESFSGDKITFNSVGKSYVTFSAKVPGGDNVYTQDYTVNVQESFSDKTAPVLSISGIPSSPSTNTAVTLPVATAKDNYDENVEVEVKVQKDGKDVPHVVVDKVTGYAAKDAEGKVLYYKSENGKYTANHATTTNVSEAMPAKFDNDSFMTFYPTEAGTYNVTYKAKDDAGNETTVYTYTITVSDKMAPVYKSLDSSLIPSTWGRDVVSKNDGNDEAEVLADKNIAFPIPEVYDNEAVAKDLKVSFALTDSKSKSVVSVTNIYATEHSQSKVSFSADYNADGKDYYFFRYWDAPETYEVDANGKFTKGITGEAYALVYKDGNVFKGNFDFAKYNPSTVKLGQYTSKYIAKDNNGNTSTRTYVTTVEASFSDLNLPTVDFDVPDYFAFSAYKTKQSITNVVASDYSDARLDVEYYVVFDSELDSAEVFFNNVDNYSKKVKLGVSGTNVATLEKVADKYVFAINNIYGEEVKTEVDISKNIFVALKATDSVGNSNVYGKSVPVVDGATTQYPSVDFDSITTDEGEVGDEYTYGGFVITPGDASRIDYTGFELYVKRIEKFKSINGSYDYSTAIAVDETSLSNVKFETYVSGGKIYIDNIRFTPYNVGNYVVVFRAFDVSGGGKVFADKITFKETSSTGGYVPVSASITNEIEYGATYNLMKDYKRPSTWENAVIVRSFECGRIKLMGTEFTALQETTYKIQTYVAKSVNEFDLGNKETYEKQSDQITKAIDKSSATWDVIGSMPVYAPIGYVNLPAVSAYNANCGATKITCKVTGPDGKAVTAYGISDTLPVGYDGDALVGNEFLFNAEDDGDYTVTYTATLNNAKVSKSYTIKVGDVTAPNFSIKGGEQNNVDGWYYVNDQLVSDTIEVTVDDTFDFAAIVVDNDDYKTFSKTLYTPEGSVACTVTSGLTRKHDGQTSYTFSTSGRYEVVYTVTDEAGNTTKVSYTINVTNTSSNISSGASMTLAIVLIIVGVIIVAIVIVYFVRFRKRK